MNQDESLYCRKVNHLNNTGLESNEEGWINCLSIKRGQNISELRNEKINTKDDELFKTKG